LSHGEVTELNCAFSLRSDTPEEIIDTLLYMTGQDDGEPQSLPSHPFFGSARWRHMLRGSDAELDAESYGIAGVEMSESSGRYRITIRCNLINFDNDIDQFIHWITPYIHAQRGDFIGYTRSQDVEPVTQLLFPNRTFTRQLPDEIDGVPV
jgi:hypothetical protein